MDELRPGGVGKCAQRSDAGSERAASGRVDCQVETDGIGRGNRAPKIDVARVAVVALLSIDCRGGGQQQILDAAEREIAVNVDVAGQLDGVSSGGAGVTDDQRL